MNYELNHSSLTYYYKECIAYYKTDNTHDETYTHHLLLLNHTSCMSKGIWRCRDWQYHSQRCRESNTDEQW